MADGNVWEMSDEELEAAFMNAKAEADSPVTMMEEDDEEITTMEQPNEDSEDDDLTVDETKEEITDENSDETDDADGDADVDEEQTDEVEETEVKEAETVPQKNKYRANGKEYEFTDAEIKEQFAKVFGQAMNYTQKTQAMKPWKKTIDAIETANLSHTDVSLMIDVLKGDKDAIAEVIRRTGTDALELDTENSKYVPKDYGRDDNALAIKDVIDTISKDKEYDTTHRILSKDWDDSSFKELTSDPETIALLHEDVKSGMFARVNPIAEKLKVFDGAKRSDLDYYKLAAVEYFKEQDEIRHRVESMNNQKIAQQAKLDKQTDIARVKATQQAKVDNTAKVEKRKAAAPVKANAGTKKVIDYLDDSDEAFEEWYKKMEDSR